MKSSVNEIYLFRPSDRDYPSRIRELPGRARVLRALGDPKVLEQGPALAIVGTRTPTEEIEHDTRRIVDIAGEFGMVILNGISPGVDVVALEAALDKGLTTLAVAGSGLDVLLASDRGKLAEKLVEAGGLLVSPFANDAEETADRRWWRNRLIAGFCHGLIVVASEPEGGAWEAHKWARQLERRLIEPSEMAE